MEEREGKGKNTEIDQKVTFFSWERHFLFHICPFLFSQKAAMYWNLRGKEKGKRLFCDLQVGGKGRDPPQQDECPSLKCNFVPRTCVCTY